MALDHLHQNHLQSWSHTQIRRPHPGPLDQNPRCERSCVIAAARADPSPQALCWTRGPPPGGRWPQGLSAPDARQGPIRRERTHTGPDAHFAHPHPHPHPAQLCSSPSHPEGKAVTGGPVPGSVSELLRGRVHGSCTSFPEGPETPLEKAELKACSRPIPAGRAKGTKGTAAPAAA